MAVSEKRRQLHELTRLLNDPEASKAFFTPEGNLNVTDPRRREKALDTLVSKYQGQYEGAFTPYYGAEAPDWLKAMEPLGVEADPISSKVSFNEAFSARLKRMGFGDSEIGAMKDRLSQKLGAFKDPSRSFTANLGRGDLPKSLSGPQAAPGSPEEVAERLASSKNELFGQVAKALSAAPTDEEKAAIIREAFGRSGPTSAQQLFDEFGQWSDVEGQRLLDEEHERIEKAAPKGAFGQIMEALDVPGDIAQSLLSGDFGAALQNVKDLPRSLATIGTVGANTMIPGVRDVTRIDRSDEKNFAKDIAPFLGEMQQEGNSGLERVLGYAGAFAGDVATDPLTYLTLGTGGLGKEAARGLLKAGVERALPELGEEAAQSAAVTVAQAYGRGSFRKALKAFESLGYDPDKLAAEFPRVGFGRAAAARTQVRGGATLRAGLPGTDAKVALNLTNRPIALSSLLDQGGVVGDFITDPFKLATKLNRHGMTARFKRDNPELAESFEGFTREARGHESRAVNSLDRVVEVAETRLTKMARKARMSDDELHRAIDDIIEEGPDSLAYTDLVTRLGARSAQEFASLAGKLRDALQELRVVAIAHGVDVPELADQAAGKLNYLPHVRAKSELQAMLASAGIKPSKVGAIKQRLITTGGGFSDPLTGVFHPVPKGTISQLNDVYARVYGDVAYQADPFQIMRAYGRSIGRAINNTHLAKRLEEEGYGVELAPDIAAHYESRGPISELIQKRAIYMEPLTSARIKEKAAEQAALLGYRDVVAANRDYARNNVAKLQAVADLSVLRDHAATNSEVVHILLRDEAEKLVLSREADELLDHETSILSEARDAELQSLKEAGAVPEQLRATTEHYEAFLRDVRADYARVRRTLSESPQAIRSRAEAHLKRLGPEAVAALRGTSGRPYNAVLMDAVDTQRTLANIAAVERYGKSNAYTALHTAMQGTEFGRLLTRATRVAQQLGELELRIANETKAGRFARAQELQTQFDQLMVMHNELAGQAAQPIWGDQVQQVLSALDDPELSEIVAATGGKGASAAEAIARYQEAALPQVPVDDLIAEQRALAAAGDLEGAATKANEIAATRELGSRLEVAQAYAEAERAVSELAELGLKTHSAAKPLVAGLKEHLDATLRELDQLHRSGLSLRDPARARRVLTQRYLREQSDAAAIFRDDWRESSQALDAAITTSATLQQQVGLNEITLHSLVREGKLRAGDVRRAEAAFDQLSLQHLDALDKLLATPTIIESMLPNLEHLALMVEKLPYANKSMALPEDIMLAIKNIANKGNRSDVLRMWRIFTNAWKRATLAVPGSTGRRLFGELIQAHFYGGMPVDMLRKGIEDAVAYRKTAGSLDNVTDPTLRGMMEQNIFEGKRVEAEAGLEGKAATTGLFGNKVAPLRRYQDTVFRANAGAEDALRAGLFRHAKENLGLSDVGARSFVGKFLFFTDEMSQLERDALTTVFPFWNFLRNNTQLQLYMLFHTPGKIAAFQNLQESVGEEIQAPFGPSSILEQGGFGLPIESEGNQEVLYPGLFDIPQGILAPTDIAEAGKGLGAGLLGQGEGVGGNEVISSMNPALQAILAGGFNINPLTGQGFGKNPEPYLGGVQLTSRQRTVFESLIPELRQAASLAAGLGLSTSPTRAEAPIENLLSVIVGPTVRPNTPRSQGYEAGDIADVLAQLNEAAGVDLGNPGGSDDTDVLNRNAREQREQLALEEAIRRLLG